MARVEHQPRGTPEGNGIPGRSARCSPFGAKNAHVLPVALPLARFAKGGQELGAGGDAGVKLAPHLLQRVGDVFAAAVVDQGEAVEQPDLQAQRAATRLSSSSWRPWIRRSPRAKLRSRGRRLRRGGTNHIGRCRVLPLVFC
jgi:hypothetical protein